MGFNFIAANRDQPFLLPPDMREWLPADHLAWFVVDVVDQLDLTGFPRAYRGDGHGRPAYDPAVMVAVLLYAYCTGLRSSRVIERRCTEDVAFRVLAGGLCPDHVTIARFRSRHADALAAGFVASLRLCAEAGLVRLGVVALDGTKMGADASLDANRTLESLDRQIADILAEAEGIDAAEDRSLPGQRTPRRVRPRCCHPGRLSVGVDNCGALRAQPDETRPRLASPPRIQPL